MLVLGLTGLMLLLIVLKTMHKYKRDPEEGKLRLFGYIPFSILISQFIIFGFIMFTGDLHFVPVREVPIYSFVNRQEIDGHFGGSFIMQSGSVENQMFYHYIANSHMGGKTIYKVSVNKASIVESNETPKLVILERQFKDSFYRKHFSLYGATDRFYKFYIPENSVDTTFEVKL